MSVLSDAAQPRGDVMRRLAELERKVAALSTARRLEAAAVGRGGLRIQGGRLLAEDNVGARVFEVTTEPASIFLRQELVGDVTREVIAEGVLTATAASQTITTSTNFGDGSSGGPSISGVEISSAGRALVLWGAQIDAGPVSGGQVGGYMGLQVTGATSVSPSTGNAAHIGQSVIVTGATVSHRAQGRVFAASTFSLNPGTHTFTGKYATQVSGETAAFTGRTLIVIGF